MSAAEKKSGQGEGDWDVRCMFVGDRRHDASALPLADSDDGAL